MKNTTTLLPFLLAFVCAAHAQQLDESCSASVLNRTAQVNADGSFVIPNVPADDALYRVFVTCNPDDGPQRRGQSGFFAMASGTTLVPTIDLTTLAPSPTALVLQASSTMLDGVGAAAQVSATCSYPGGSSRDCTSPGRGTTFNSSNAAICSVDPAGRIVAAGSGSCLITAINQGVVGTLFVTVQVGEDADGDGLPNDYELANPCLDATEADAELDFDNDGLFASEEFAAGTDPCVADSDADGLTDGDELTRGTDALLADSDLDGLNDGEEVALGTDPLSADGDGDGLTDAVEVALDCVDPNLADTDFNGVADPQEDCDLDNLTNADELALGTDPSNPDTDGGGRLDGDEVFIDGTDPLNPVDDISDISFPVELVDGDGFSWEIEADGTIETGFCGGYDEGLALRVGGLLFPEQVGGTVEDGGREIVLGPQQLGELIVTRKIFVPADDGFARFVEILANPGVRAVTTRVTLDSELSGFSIDVEASGNGDLVFDTSDDYLITLSEDFGETAPPPVVVVAADEFAQNAPLLQQGSDGCQNSVLLHSVSGPSGAIGLDEASLIGDYLRYGFEVTVPAGGRAAVMHFSTQSLDVAPAAAGAAQRLVLGGSERVGLAPLEEQEIVNFLVPDGDLDGLRDDDETAAGTDPANPDSDGDGLLDGFEVAFGLDPLTTNEASDDGDGDGLDNLAEQQQGTLPLSQDSDLDGLFDGAEVATHLTDPLQGDSDRDCLLDGVEVDQTQTDPLDPDSDGGRRTDGVETLFDATDPLDAADDLPAETVPFVQTGALWVMDDSCDCIVALDRDGSLRYVLAERQTENVGDGGSDLDDNALVFDLLGNAYFTDDDADAVIRLERDGELSITLDSDEMVAVTGEFSAVPRGLTFGADGALYVTEAVSDTVLRLDLSSGELSTWIDREAIAALLGGQRGQLEHAMVAASDGSIYLAAESFGGADLGQELGVALLRADADGTVTLVHQGEPLSDISYMTLSPEGELYVLADGGDAPVYRVAGDGSVEVYLTREAFDIPGAEFPPDLDGGFAFDAEGFLYIAEDGMDVVLRFDPAGVGEVWLTEAAISAVTGDDADLDAGIAFAPDPCRVVTEVR